MNTFIHPYLALYVVFISLKTLFLSVISILIYILETLCTHAGESQFYTIFILYFVTLFLIIILITYSITFMIYLFLLPTYLFFFLYLIITLIVFYVLYFFILCIVVFVQNKHYNLTFKNTVLLKVYILLTLFRDNPF